jgi:Putative auto-transporter adhesin, head GIN domain
MKKFFVSAFVFMTLFTNSFSQNMRPLTGNGVEKKVAYDISAFEAFEVLWLDGKIDVEFGAAKSYISIETDENIFSLLKVTNTEGVLKLEIPTNYGNRLWLEDDRTTIKIRTTAQARRISYKANANARFTNINSPILNINKDGNGNILLEGKAAILEIDKKDNGNIDAENLLAQQATISSTGNGNVSVNAKLLKKQRVWGNGGVSNKMDVVETGGAINTDKSYLKRVNVTLFNPEPLRKEYQVSGTNTHGRKFSYGLELKGMGKQSEVLPVGTNFYRKGKLIATLKESDENKEVRL